MEEGGPVTRVNTFIGEREHPLLGRMMGGARPDGWIAHVLSAEISSEACLAHVQLFVCEDYRAPIYAVRLTREGRRSCHRCKRPCLRLLRKRA